MFDREAAGGVALVGRSESVGGHHPDGVEVDAEFPGGNRRNRSHRALADLHLAGAQAHHAVGIERHPAIERGVGGEIGGQGAHVRRPFRSAMARSTARRMRTCEPHLQRWRSSSVATIWSRSAGGSGASMAATVMMMPLMQ